MGEAADLVHIPGHQGQRLFLAVLAPAQALHGGFVFGIHGQVETAEPLDGGDAAGREPCDDLRHRIFGGHRLSIGRQQGEPRTAFGAGIGLGMKAAVGGIVVFRLAAGAHAKGRHGGLGAVVGKTGNDRIARAAVGAVDKRVAVAAIPGGAHFFEAIRAHGHVRGYQHGGTGFLRAAGDDLEGFEPLGRGVADFDRNDLGQGRRVGGNAGHEGLNGLRRALHMDVDAGGGVGYMAAEVAAAGELEDIGAEADPLDDALDLDAFRRKGRWCRGP